ncbi:MAG TPA: hypothetical protein VEF36_08395 [Roseiarcus sp.]|nr:hypothetical protein [Roseiarcus sp.]
MCGYPGSALVAFDPSAALAGDPQFQKPGREGAQNSSSNRPADLRTVAGADSGRDHQRRTAAVLVSLTAIGSGNTLAADFLGFSKQWRATLDKSANT